MTSLSAIAVVQALALVAATDDYSEAHRAITETGTPMVVMVGADWCPACQSMKQTVIPKIRDRGLLRKVAFAVVNFDRDRDLAQQLTGGGPIPQLLMYRKTPKGWFLKKLVGGQSVETVETFITEGVQMDQASKQPEGSAPNTAQASGTKAVQVSASKPAGQQPTQQPSAKTNPPAK